MSFENTYTKEHVYMYIIYPFYLYFFTCYPFVDSIWCSKIYVAFLPSVSNCNGIHGKSLSIYNGLSVFAL